MADIMQATSISCACLWALVAVFSVGFNLATNALWAQLPVLRVSAPERHQSKYVLAGLSVGNCAGILIWLLKRQRKRDLHCNNDPTFIYSAFVLSAANLVMLGCFWDYKASLMGVELNTVLLVCACVGAACSCIAELVCLELVTNVRWVYGIAVLLGNNLSDLLSHLLAIGQGINQISTYRSTSSVHINCTDFTYQRSYQPARAQTVIAVTSRLRVSQSNLFFIYCGFVAVCTVVFASFHYASNRAQTQHKTKNSQNAERARVRQKKKSDFQRLNACKTTGAASAESGHNSTKGARRFDRGKEPTTFVTVRDKKVERQVILTVVSDEAAAVLLFVATVWNSVMLSGPLSVMKAYASYPTGNNLFTTSATITPVLMIVMYIAGVGFSSRSRLTFVMTFTALGTIIELYFMALVWFSRGARAYDSLVFGRAGELFAATVWVVVSCLFCYANALTAVECAVFGRKTFAWFVCLRQMAITIGGLSVLGDFSIATMFRHRTYCYP